MRKKKKVEMKRQGRSQAVINYHDLKEKRRKRREEIEEREENAYEVHFICYSLSDYAKRC